MPMKLMSDYGSATKDEKVKHNFAKSIASGENRDSVVKDTNLPQITESYITKNNALNHSQSVKMVKDSLQNNNWTLSVQ